MTTRILQWMRHFKGHIEDGKVIFDEGEKLENGEYLLAWVELGLQCEIIEIKKIVIKGEMKNVNGGSEND